MHASTDAFVRAWVWRGHNEPYCAVVLEKASLFSHHILLRARLRDVINDKRPWGPLRQIGGGLPKQYHLLRRTLESRVKDQRWRASVAASAVWWACSVLLRSMRTLGP